jgi:hypothetical protein
MIQRRETTKVHAGGVVPDLHVSVGAGDGNRTRMTSLEEGSPQGWGVLVVLAELPPAAPSNPSRSAPCRTRVAREDHDGPSSPDRCLPVRSSPSAAPLLAISRVSGVVWLVVVVIAPLAAAGHHSLPTQNVAFADWMTDHGHFFAWTRYPPPTTRPPRQSFARTPACVGPPESLASFSLRAS